MRILIALVLVLGLSACHGHRGGAAHVDGVGGVNWGGSNYHSNSAKGCPPGLAKQGRCW